MRPWPKINSMRILVGEAERPGVAGEFHRKSPRLLFHLRLQRASPLSPGNRILGSANDRLKPCDGGEISTLPVTGNRWQSLAIEAPSNHRRARLVTYWLRAPKPNGFLSKEKARIR
jgi:hypothetical protein